MCRFQVQGQHVPHQIYCKEEENIFSTTGWTITRQRDWVESLLVSDFKVKPVTGGHPRDPC